MSKLKIPKKILSLLLVFTMILANIVIPTTSYAAEPATPEECMEQYLSQKIISNGGDGIVRSTDGLTYEIGFKTPSGIEIESLKFIDAPKPYRVVWHVDSTDAEYLTAGLDTLAVRSIKKRPAPTEEPFSVKVTLKLFDDTVKDNAIWGNDVPPLLTKDITIKILPEEPVYDVSFEAIDAKTKVAIPNATIQVEKGYKTIKPENGTYKMPKGEIYTVTAEAQGYRKYSNNSFTATKSGKEILELESLEMVTAKFNVKDAEGNPITKPEITVKKGYSTIKAEKDGSYKLEKGTDYTYTVSADNYSSETKKINLTKDENFTVVLKKDIKNYNVTFNVMDQNKKPVKNPKIEVSYTEYDDWEMDYVNYPAEKNPDGSFQLSKNQTYDYTITAPGYRKATGTIKPSGDNADYEYDVILSLDKPIDPADQKKVDAIKKEYDKEFGVLKPDYKTDKNIVALVQKKIEGYKDLDTKGVTVSLATSNDTDVIRPDGTINYIAINNLGSSVNSVNVGCTFKISCGDAEVVTSSRNATIGWDRNHFNKKMKEESKELTIDKLLNGNTDANAITGNLTLPRCMNSSLMKAWSVIEWESSNPEVISLEKPTVDSPINPLTGTVTPQSKDTQVTLTAKFKANDTVLNAYVEKPADFATFEIPFVVTVKGTAAPVPTESELNALLEKYYVPEIRDLATKEKLNFDKVHSDISLPRYTKIKDENNKLVFENKEITVTSSDEKLLEINGYRGTVDIFYPQDKKVNLIVKFTRKGVTVEKQIPLTISMITDAELDAELAKMDLAKKDYFNGIKGNNTSSNSITSDLHAFMEMHVDEKGNPLWIYDYKDTTDEGIIPDDFFDDPWEMEGAGYNKFNSSKPSIIKYDNLKVTRPEISTEVEVSSLLSSAKYGKFAPAHPENKKLQKLYKQPVSIKVTVKGTKAVNIALEEAINKAKDFADKMKTGTNPGEYPIEAKAQLEKAIAEAQKISNTPNLTEEAAEEAAITLTKVMDETINKCNPSVSKVTIFANNKANEIGTRITCDVKSNEATKLGYYKSEEFKNKVTVIDALVALHRQMYGADLDANPEKYLAMSKNGWLTTIFGVNTSNSGYLVNGATPVYEGTTTSSVANDTLLDSGDTLSVFLYNSPSWDDIYLEFAKFEVKAMQTEDFTLTLKGFKPMSYPEPDKMGPKEGFTVRLTSKTDSTVFYDAVTDANGIAKFNIDKAGDYTATVISGAEYFMAPYAEVSVAVKEADYSKVNAAVNRANELDRNQYVNFEDVDKAISAVVRGKDITEQNTVDAYAEAIEMAINSLKKVSKPSVDENKGDSENSIVKPDNSKPSTSTDSAIKTPVAPKTGDNTNMTIWIVVILIAAIAIVFIYRKFKK